MTELDKDNIRSLLEWRDAALRTCGHLGMYVDELAAYVYLCKAVDKVPVIGGRNRPELVEAIK